MIISKAVQVELNISSHSNLKKSERYYSLE